MFKNLSPLDAVRDLKEKVESGIEKTVDAGKAAIGEAKSNIDNTEKILGPIKNPVVGGLDVMKNVGGKVFDTAGKVSLPLTDGIGKVTGAISDIKDKAKDSVGKVTGAIGNVTDKVDDLIQKPTDFIKDVAKDSVKNITHGVGKVVDGVHDVANAVTHPVSTASKIINNGKKITSKVFNTVTYPARIVSEKMFEKMREITQLEFIVAIKISIRSGIKYAGIFFRRLFGIKKSEPKED